MDSSLAELLTAFQSGDLQRARTLAEAELAIDDSRAEVLHVLGLVDCRSGRIEQGAKWLKQALDLDPQNANFRIMAVRALVDAGRPTDALEAAAFQPNNLNARLALSHARAEAAAAAEQWEIAAAGWTELATAQPGQWHWWANLADALAHLERWSETHAALAEAVRLNPGDPSLRRNLSSALVHCNRFDEAAEVIRELVERDSANPDLRIGLARVYADLGRHADAMEQLDRAASLTVHAASADQARLIEIVLGAKDEPQTAPDEKQIGQLRELALLLERTSKVDALEQLLADARERGVEPEQLGYAAAAMALRQGEVERARELLLNESPAGDPLRWHHLMARIADAARDPETAFESANSMNRAVHEFDDWRRRGKAYRDRIRRLARSMDDAWVRDRSDLPPPSPRTPVFLVGFPRSGTTLLDTILMGHPQLHVLEEEHLLIAAESVLGDLFDLPRWTPAQLLRAQEAYFSEMDRLLPEDFAGNVVDKLPLNMLGLPLIRSLFPEAKVIFAQRHPCDPVLSGFMQSFVMNDAMACFLTIEDAADLYDAAMSMWSQSREMMPIEVHTVTYEKLVEDAESELQALVEFLDLEWHDDLLNHRQTAIQRGAVITPSYDQITKPLYRTASGRWRRYEKQLEPVLPVLLPWAEKLGY